jgi:4-nitrophenyl phosphatase
MDISKIDTFLLDGDGVLWRENQPLPGIHRFFSILRKRDKRWALLTNNNTRTVDDYLAKLAGFGIEASAEQIFSSSTTTAVYLQKRYGPGAAIHAVGMKGLIEALKGADLAVSYGETMPTNGIAAVAAGLDRAMTYEKAKVATRLILNGAEFVATNTDGTYPAPDGLSPGTGYVIGALIGITGVHPTVIGKPEAAIFTAAMESLNATVNATVMIGDRLETDILGAQRLGIATIGVLSGVSTLEEITASKCQPDIVYENIAGLVEALEELE